jgi:hypothetical protein
MCPISMAHPFHYLKDLSVYLSISLLLIQIQNETNSCQQFSYPDNASGNRP